MMPDESSAFDRFEHYLSRCPMPGRMSIIKVCDTAFMAMTWFRVREIPFDAGDVVAMTSLILQNEKDSRREEGEEET